MENKHTEKLGTPPPLPNGGAFYFISFLIFAFHVSWKFGNIVPMSRGSTTLFSDIIHTSVLPEKQSKGRSKSLIEGRNELLINRHYFFLRNFKFSYDSVLEILEDEFYIGVITIPQIMARPDNRAILHRLKQNPPDISLLEKKWPHLVWDQKTLLLIYGRKIQPNKMRAA